MRSQVRFSSSCRATNDSFRGLRASVVKEGRSTRRELLPPVKAANSSPPPSETDEIKKEKNKGFIRSLADKAGVSLGPISLTFGDDFSKPEDANTNGTTRKDKTQDGKPKDGILKDVADAAGVSLGPISLSFGDDFSEKKDSRRTEAEEDGSFSPGESIANMTNEEWRAKYEVDGCVDLWVEEEFNAGSRLVGGRDVHNGGVYGFQTGEGPSAGTATSHHVRIHNRYADQIVEVEVPEDRYVMWEAEDNGLELPYACRMGCCTACAVKIKEGEMYQPQALGISQGLKEQGYALMCVGYPRSDLVLETIDEDEAYDMQFGNTFAERALNKNANTVDRDDFALELADMDE